VSKIVWPDWPSINQVGDMLVLDSNWTPQLAQCCHKVGGVNQGRRIWHFSPAQAARVEEMARQIYGCVGTPPPDHLVSVHLDLDVWPTGRQAWFAGRNVATRTEGKPAAVPTLHPTAKLVSGRFVRVGGTVDRTLLGAEHVVLLVSEVPAGHADLARPGVSVLLPHVLAEPAKPVKIGEVRVRPAVLRPVPVPEPAPQPAPAPAPRPPVARGLAGLDPGKARLLAAMFAYADGPTPAGLPTVRQAELVVARAELVSQLAEVERELADLNIAPGVPGLVSGVPPVSSEGLGVPDVPAEPTKAKGKPRRAQGGYSAIELVIVLALMSILMVVSVPVYSGITARAHQVVHQEQVSAQQEQAQINQILAGS
jgi:prepilin-type N-terminal cleavage/methylation domain-containing protein